MVKNDRNKPGTATYISIIVKGKIILQMFMDRDGTGINTTETRMGSLHYPHVLSAIPISLNFVFISQ